MTNSNIPDPVDLPIGSRPAWRALVKAVQDLHGETKAYQGTIGVLQTSQQAVYTALENQILVSDNQAVEMREVQDKLQPTEFPDMPSTPTLDSAVSGVVVNWDGNVMYDAVPIDTTAAIAVPAYTRPGFRHVFAEQGTSSTGPWTTVGQPLNQTGSINVSGLTVGATLWYRLTSVDYAGKVSPPSPAVSIVVTGVETVDLDAAVIGAINTANSNASAALTAANGKNTVFYATTAPSLTGRVAGDVWFDTDDGNKMYGFQGGAWVAEEWGTNAIENLAITNGKIAALAVDNAKISNLDAGKITAGSLDANRIAANSLTAGKLLITSMENLCEDGSFEYSTASPNAWTYAGGASSGTTNPRTGARALSANGAAAAYVAANQNNVFSVAQDERYRISAWVRVNSGVSAVSGVALRFSYGATAATATTATADIVTTPNGTGTTYVRITGIWTVPSGAKFAKPQVVMRDTTVATQYLVDDVEVFKMTMGELVVDGEITGTHIKANTITANNIAANTITANQIAAFTITANELSPTVGGTIDISANDQINFILGQQTAQGGAISGLQDDVATAQTTADTATTAAGTADTKAKDARDVADAAKLVADNADAKIDAQNTTYSFTTTGAFIKATESPYQFVIKNTGAQIMYNDEVVSEWNANQMIVTSFVGTTVSLGNHQLEKYTGPGGGTIVRAI